MDPVAECRIGLGRRCGKCALGSRSCLGKRGWAAALLVLALLVAAVPAISWTAPAKCPNFVLIIVDSLRPDCLGCYGGDPATSPVIDQLASTGVVFEQAVSHAPWTKTSFASILTSLYPFQHGVIDWEYALPDSISTLPEVLQSHGYSTRAVINMLGLTGDSKVTKGFDKVSEAHQKDRDAAATTEAAIELINGSREPFFLLVHYFDAHWPYRCQADESGGSSGAKPGADSSDPLAAVRQRYAACIKRTDTSIGDLVAFLRQDGILENTVLIITADHGDAFMEHGSASHGTYVYDEEVMVPLVINYPARYSVSRRIGEQVRHIDLLPTIVDLAGAVDSGKREGTSLDHLAGEGSRGASEAATLAARGTLLAATYAICESDLGKAPWSKCIRTNGWKLVVVPPTSQTELYDLTRDPGEKTNLWKSRPAGGDSLLEMIEAVPGTRIQGWRIAYAGGAARAGVTASVKVEDGGRISYAEAAAGGNMLLFRLSADSTRMAAQIPPQGVQILLFDVVPADKPVTLEFTCPEEKSPEAVWLGTASRELFGRPFQAPGGGFGRSLGLPLAFSRSDSTNAFEVFVWWLPGDEVTRARKTVPLSSQERDRLKSLGYLH